jgi:hypothetical protein
MTTRKQNGEAFRHNDNRIVVVMENLAVLLSKNSYSIKVQNGTQGTVLL